MHKLYDIALTEQTEKEGLYVRDAVGKELIGLPRNRILDFVTYFNSVHISKWLEYTTMESLMLKLAVKGRFRIKFLGLFPGKETVIITDEFEDFFECVFSASELQGFTVVGFTLESLNDGGCFVNGAYYGEFSDWQERKIGIATCTYRREKYVERTIALLREYMLDHEWLQLLVIDNGQTLEPIEEQGVRIIHNPNYGGSGGFTRGLVEYVEAGQVDYVQLMDDDIVLETAALDRTHSLLSGLKAEFRDSFLSGAMLSIEKPTIQYENTAYWHLLRLHSFYKNLDLTNKTDLVRNGIFDDYSNHYPAWWYCCIPLHRIKEIGYPLPVFIKSDDIEYGIRNERPVLAMNGIGIWHETFKSKESPVVRYHADRNSFILNCYARNCNFFTLMLSIAGRLVKKFMPYKFENLHIMSMALRDFASGFEGICQIGSDKNMHRVAQEINKGGGVKYLGLIFFYWIKIALNYRKITNGYRDFRTQNLRDASFWKRFLNV